MPSRSVGVSATKTKFVKFSISLGGQSDVKVQRDKKKLLKLGYL